MSDNDLIRREDVVEYIKTHQCAKCSDIGLCGGCAVLIALKLIEDVPAVSREMSAVEFLKTKARMKTAMGFPGIADIEKMRDAVAFAEKWAREHPEERNEDDAKV